MAKQIVVDLVADTSDFQRQMAKAAGSVDGMESKLKSAAKSQDDLAETFDRSETKLMGAADLFDGLATTMGLPIDQAITMSRGFADMASGIKTTLIPAVQGAITKMKAMSSAMLATPWGKYALGLGLAAGATIALVASTEEGRGALSRLGDVVKERVNTQLKQMGDAAKWADDHTGGLGQKLLNIVPGFNKVSAAAQDSALRMDQWNREAAWALKMMDIANNLGGTPSDPDGAFASAAWVEANTGQAAWVAYDAEQAAAAQASANKASNAAKKSAKQIADDAARAIKEKFGKYKDVLVKALQGWTDKLNDAKALKKTVKNLFTLDIGAARQDPFGLVHGLGVQAKNMKKFIDVIKKLRAMGFREGLIRQLVDQGPSALADAIELSHVSKKDVNELYDANNRQSSQFANNEAYIRTGVDVKNPKPVKVTLDIKGGDKELRDMIKKWVRTDGGGNVQVAFGKR